MKQIIECVPNFSEGNNMDIIKQITDEIEAVNGVHLLNVDAGKAANRTVVTFAGSPANVCEAAFRAVKKAAELIDMRQHKGEHPRIGAIDVCPLIPVAGISMEETIEYAYKLAFRIGEELRIPVYCYEFAAKYKKRKNLANCRAGEYEGLSKKLTDPDWKPDFGPVEFNTLVARTGATVVGARNFLVAYNVNLNTKSSILAKIIASEIREKGYLKREGNSREGKIITDKKGNRVYVSGLLKSVKGIGWYLEDFGIAQVSFNLTNLSLTSVHEVYETTCKQASIHGLKVTGSELIGLIPLKSMLDAGRYFLIKQKKSIEISDNEIIEVAIKSLVLDELKPFDPQHNIIEYVLEKKQK